MNNTVDEIKRRIDIVEYIGSFVSLKKAGRNFKANCPFHKENSPSFVVSPDRQIWHCFGACHEGGDVIKFLMKRENITFFEAIIELAKKTGVNIENLQPQDDAWAKKERLIKINRLAADFFKYLLHEPRSGEKAREYLSARGIHPKIVQKFEIGYAVTSWDLLMRYFEKKQFTRQELLDAGLVVKNERNSVYDRFRDRIVFPIKDPRGVVIGFSGRTLEPESTGAKYINTPETLLYHKRETLYNIDLAKDAIVKSGNVYLVEGEFDVIAPYQHGFENFVAIKGSAVTREQLALLSRFTSRITLTLDSDEAGETAVQRAIKESESGDFELQVVILTSGKDPDEAIKNNLGVFKHDIDKPVAIYDYLIQAAEKKYDIRDPFGKKKFAEELSAVITDIANPIVKSHYVKKIAALLSVTEDSVGAMLRRQVSKTKSYEFVKTAKPVLDDQSRHLVMQKYLLSYLLQQDSVQLFKKDVLSILVPEDFTIRAYQKIYELLLSWDRQDFNIEEFAKSVPVELQPIFNEVYLYAAVEQPLSQANVQKIAYEIKRIALKNQIHQRTKADDEANITEAAALQKQLNQVEKMIQEV